MQPVEAPRRCLVDGLPDYCLVAVLGHAGASDIVNVLCVHSRFFRIGRTAISRIVTRATPDAVSRALCRLSFAGNVQGIEVMLRSRRVDMNKAQRLKSFLRARTPLMYACMEGHVGAVRRLVSAPRVDVNLQMEEGWSAASLAVLGRHSECLRELCRSPKFAWHTVMHDGATLVHLAAEVGAVECMKILFSAPQIDVNRQTIFGCTPLMLACTGGHTECVSALLKRNDLHVNAVDEHNRSALHLAAYSENLDALHLIMKHPDVDITLYDSDGDTALTMVDQLRRAKTAHGNFLYEYSDLLCNGVVV